MSSPKCYHVTQIICGHMTAKFSNSSISMREIIITSILTKHKLSEIIGVDFIQFQ